MRPETLCQQGRETSPGSARFDAPYFPEFPEELFFVYVSRGFPPSSLETHAAHRRATTFHYRVSSAATVFQPAALHTRVSFVAERL